MFRPPLAMYADDSVFCGHSAAPSCSYARSQHSILLAVAHNSRAVFATSTRRWRHLLVFSAHSLYTLSCRLMLAADLLRAPSSIRTTLCLDCLPIIILTGPLFTDCSPRTTTSSAQQLYHLPVSLYAPPPNICIERSNHYRLQRLLVLTV